jgi:membrane-bound serine protease (ClpP class)
VVSLFLGSIMLIDSPLPELQIGLRLIVPVTIGLSAVLLFLVNLAVRAQRTPSVTGTSGMLGEVGEALTSIEAGGIGRVRTHGEIWSAMATQPVAPGDLVRVTDVRGLRLTVTPEHRQVVS